MMTLDYDLFIREEALKHIESKMKDVDVSSVWKMKNKSKVKQLKEEVEELRKKLRKRNFELSQ